MPTAQATRSAPNIVTLVVIAAIGPMAINVFLPSLPNMARYFNADYRVIQLLVSLYLVATAAMQLIIGPLSDRYGRRPVLLWSLAIFAASTLAAVYVPTVELLIVCRLFQATSAAGMVLSRAAIRDTVASLEDAASRIGYVTMGMSIMPMIAPAIGGYLDELYGWKATFLLTFAFTLVALAFVAVDFGETNRNRSNSMLAQVRSYPELIRSRRFWGYSLAAGFSSGGFFAFIGGGPFVATEMLAMSPSDYGLYFIFVSLGYMVGNYFSGRFSRQVGTNRMILAGNVVGMVGGIGGVALFAAGMFDAAVLFGTAGAIGIGNGMTLPNSNAGMVSVRPQLAGSAAGLGGTVQIGISAWMAFVAGSLLTLETGPLPLLVVILTSMGLSVAASHYVIIVSRGAPELGSRVDDGRE